MSERTLAVALRRTAWVPILVTVACGLTWSVSRTLVTERPFSPGILLPAAATGLLLGAVAAVTTLVVANAQRSVVFTAALSAITVAAISAGAAWLLTRGFVLLPMVGAGVLAVVAHVAAAVRFPAKKATDADRSGDASPTEEESRSIRIGLLLGGGLVTAMLSMGTVGMLREQLHVGCTYGTEGEATGAWMCADGIGYIFPGLSLLLASGLPVLIGLLIVLADVGERRLRLALTWLAFISLLLPIGALAIQTVYRVDPLPVGESWPGIWMMRIGIAALLATAGAVLLASARRPVPRWIAVALLAGSLVQPGLLFAVTACGALLLSARVSPAHLPVRPPG